MSELVVAVGEKLHIITRRNYKEDLRRHFAGQVSAVSGPLIRIEGFTFVFNPTNAEYGRKPELRTRIFGVGDSQLIINVLPASTMIEQMHYHTYDGRLVVTDGAGFRLDVNEFGWSS